MKHRALRVSVVKQRLVTTFSLSVYLISSWATPIAKCQGCGSVCEHRVACDSNGIKPVIHHGSPLSVPLVPDGQGERPKGTEVSEEHRVCFWVWKGNYGDCCFQSPIVSNNRPSSLSNSLRNTTRLVKGRKDTIWPLEKPP